MARVEGSFANVEASIAQSRAALAQLEKKLGAPVEAQGSDAKRVKGVWGVRGFKV